MGAVLYSTDFSSFPVGDDQLVGHDGWDGNSIGQGVHGVGENLVSGLGKSGWIGYGLPRTNLVKIYRSMAGASNSPPSRISFAALIGISSSISGGDDIFNVSFHNTGGVFLASMKFNTSLNDFGIWTDNGVTKTFTGSFFTLDQIHTLSIEIDLQTNGWSGYLDGATVFQNSRFTASSAARNAGSFALEWQIANMQDPGDNWLLFDNLSVAAPDLRIKSVQRLDDGSVRLEWTVPKAATNQVQISSDCLSWSNLPGALLPARPAGTTLNYLDQTAASPPHRFYRIIQLP